MRILSIIAVLLMVVPAKSKDWNGVVRVTPSGSHVLQTDGFSEGYSYPKRSYVLGYALHYSNLNQESLEDVPGIGPSLAKKIMRFRLQNKQATWEDIDGISGVGPKKLKTLQKSRLNQAAFLVFI